jgi:hypothetical protein
MMPPMDDEEPQTLGAAIREAIALALQEGADGVAEELRAVLHLVPASLGGELPN